MREIAISKFRADCFGAIEQVRKTGMSIRITLAGHPVAEIVPISAPSGASWLGCMRDQMEVTGDIVGPVHAFEGRRMGFRR